MSASESLRISIPIAPGSSDSFCGLIGLVRHYDYEISDAQDLANFNADSNNYGLSQ